MISRMQGIVRANKTLFANIFSLGTLQIFNYIVPLLVLPYVLRIIGPAKFGEIAFSLSFVSLFAIIVNYGFNLSVTGKIAALKTDTKKVSEIFCSAIAIRIVLAMLSFVGIWSISSLFPSIFPHQQLVFVCAIMLIGEALLPSWMYQGMEKMKYLTIATIFVRTAAMWAVFMLVSHEGDYVRYAAITSVSQALLWLALAVYAVRLFRLEVHLPSLNAIKTEIHDGWNIFLSTISIGLYTSSTTFILGLFASTEVVGWYATAEKLLRAVQWLMWPVSQALFPNVANKVHSLSRDGAIAFLRKVAKPILVMGCVLSLGMFAVLPYLAEFAFGSKYASSMDMIRVLSFVPLLVALSNLFGMLTMLNLGYKRAFSAILISCSAFSIFLSFPLSYYWWGIWMTMAVSITEFAVTACMYIFLRTKGVYLFRSSIPSHE